MWKDMIFTASSVDVKYWLCGNDDYLAYRLNRIELERLIEDE